MDKIVFEDFTGGDIAGLVIFSLFVIGIGISALFGAKWYIWGPKRKAAKELKAKQKQANKLTLSPVEEKLLKTNDGELSSQDLIKKNKIEIKVKKFEQKKEKEILSKKERKEKLAQEKKVQREQRKEYNKKLREQKEREKALKKGKK